MLTTLQVKAVLDEIAPPALAAEWDNGGLLVDCGGTVTKLLVALDITGEVVSEAEARGCQMIVAHHPVIYQPLKSIARGQVAYRLVRKGISALCAHTSLDAAAGGVSDVLAVIFGITSPAPFAGYGRVGRLYEPADTESLAEKCAVKLKGRVKYADTGKRVETLAVMSGSGGGLLADALAAGADCVLTGEADHHDAIDAVQAGVSLIVAGHFATEFPVVPVLADRLAARLPEAEVLISRRGRDPFTYL